MAHTLCVIDMQSEFDAALDPNVVIGVHAQILKTKRLGGDILFVEYEGCGETHKGLLDAARGYGSKARITKKSDDGSQEILRAINRRGFTLDRLRLVGVNAECCVLATIKGLLRRVPEIEIDVVKKACGWHTCEPDWRYYPKNLSIRLV